MFDVIDEFQQRKAKKWLDEEKRSDLEQVSEHESQARDD